ncbi:5' exonuclease Apollo-like isoform X2 [Stegodyphus dumicola]|uniref:5' exonuclease Apollo-like isoform X2 n=1 Tax=Stegodyphus dumicola TaxID=202533 RepID=UPI0015AEA69D|nr:5' exonuclease Apollo-like isoform X2 [Stegodyphus dumicola]
MPQEYIEKIKPSLVKSLEIGEDHLIPLDIDNQEMVTITLFDANHCPGSVMFLFSGYFGDILYTGDFRYKPEIFGAFQLPPIDVLYLDNTYCSPKCFFPTREDVIEKILSQVHDCLVKNDRIFLGLDNLGKEDLLLAIAKERNCKIWVNPNRKEVMSIIGFPDIFTSDKSETKIFVVPTNQISIRNMVEWNKEMKTHAILATARFCGFNFKPFSAQSDIHVIPYSNHSSYLELKKFIKEVKPASVIPIVGKHVKGIFGTDISDRADMKVFQEFLRESTASECVIPASVKRTMSLCELNNNACRPLKKRKIARKMTWRRPLSVGIRYIVSEDSGTDSDPDAIHIEGEKTLISCNEGVSEFSSSEISENYDSEESDSDWEVTLVTGKGSQKVPLVK